jgi:hypothetical protein
MFEMPESFRFENSVNELEKDCTDIIKLLGKRRSKIAESH